MKVEIEITTEEARMFLNGMAIRQACGALAPSDPVDKIDERLAVEILQLAAQQGAAHRHPQARQFQLIR